MPPRNLDHLAGTIEVRSARATDVPSIRGILREWVTDVDVRISLIEDALAGSRPDCEFVVAEAGGIIGVAGLQSSNIDAALASPDERAVEVITAYVRHAHRGTGVGRALLDALENRSRELGFTVLLVVSGSRNRESGYPFWRRRYGEPMRWDDDYFGPGEERVVWRCRLGV